MLMIESILTKQNHQTIHQMLKKYILLQVIFFCWTLLAVFRFNRGLKKVILFSTLALYHDALLNIPSRIISCLSQ